MLKITLQVLVNGPVWMHKRSGNFLEIAYSCVGSAGAVMHFKSEHKNSHPTLTTSFNYDDFLRCIMFYLGPNV